MKISKPILFGPLLVIGLSVLGLTIWAETPLGPAPAALLALESDSQVTVTIDDLITFQPADIQPTTGFIFYPGARVDYRSYAAPLHAIAARGYLVALVRVPLNIAFFDIHAGDPVFALFPEIAHWAAGGHSLGGVASALFAKDRPEIEGLIFWASYPADDSLKTSDIRILSIYGTRDMGGMQVFEDKSSLLPADTQYVVIDGGNHAQFGDYGFQPGDNQATISAVEQQKQVVEASADFLHGLGSP